ncbi:hypothetical protein GJAV_G00222840 [Gymnothorax javanicus]|nr:hypothetical protein GJAV_G00222840 [Gymnothorax javanicus]
MASRFAQMSQRDCSVPMLRVKMSRRRSQAQKENRDLAVSRHRGLHRLPELEGMDQGATQPDSQDKKHSIAVEERKKMLARYKEAKELQKEKERRALEKKGGVFKVGVYKPQPLASLPQAPARTKTMLNSLSNKAPSSVKPQHPLKKENVSVPRKVEPAVKPVKTGMAQNPQLAPPTGISKIAPAERTTRAQAVRTATKTQTAPPPGRGKTAPGPHGRSVKKDGNPEQKPAVIKNKLAAGSGQKIKESKMEMPTSPPLSLAALPEGREEPLQRDAAPDERIPSPSFAPQGFVFEPPAGVSSFPPGPKDTVSKEASLSPSPSDDTPVAVVSDLPAAPEACPEPASPSLSPPNPATPQSASNSQEPEHDVQYFRAVMASEANRLTELCSQWDPRTEEPTIPEEIRERVRTAVGQARLLMRERFGQFQGLVNDCALGRGEKVTTCADLQGFWDMVFYQVEDVNRKFNILKEVESRGWKEEQKPLPQVKRAPKKPPRVAVAGTAAGEGGARAAARSRLAAVKAAMKAKREADSQHASDTPAGEAPPQPPAEAQTVVFHGGFFLVESPAKVSGSVRRTSVLRASSSSFTPSRVRTPRQLILPPASSPYLTPRVTPTRQTNPAAHVSLSPRPSPSVRPATPSPDCTLTTEQEAHSGAPDEVCHLTPCPVSSALCSMSPAPLFC